MSALKLKYLSPAVARLRYASQSARTTVHPAEIDFFENLTGDWWDAQGPLRILLKMNAVRVPLIQEYLTNAGLAHIAYAETKTPLRGIHILDVGCGGGLLSETLAKLGANVTGVDAGKDVLRAAKNHIAHDLDLQKHLRYQLALIEDFSQSHRECFDAVVSSEVIEHVNNPGMFVKHCAECLKPGGSIIFTTMNRTPLNGFFNITFMEHIIKKIPKGTHTYDQFITPREVKMWLEDNGCKTVGVQGFTLNPFTERWFRAPVTWYNYALHAIKGGQTSNQATACKYAGTDFSDEAKN